MRERVVDAACVTPAVLGPKLEVPVPENKARSRKDGGGRQESTTAWHSVGAGSVSRLAVTREQGF